MPNAVARQLKLLNSCPSSAARSSGSMQSGRRLRCRKYQLRSATPDYSNEPQVIPYPLDADAICTPVVVLSHSRASSARRQCTDSA
jgi:hypothetical protein